MTHATNPVLTGCHPDPSVCRVGATYYLVTSTFEYFPGLPIFRSEDLVTWQPIGHAIDRADQLDLDGIVSSGGLFAPTLRYDDGTFWLVCTLVDPHDPTRGGNFLVTATDPSGPWSDPVWLGLDGIDPSLLFDDDGRVWLHGTRLAPDPEWPDQTEVWVREIDRATGRRIGAEHVVWTGAVRGAVWAEGPHLYAVDGRYHLLAAEGGTDVHHAVCVARSDSVTGPYVGNPANPVLTHRHLGRDADVVGVGHADLVQAPDGSWWAVLLGMRPYGGYHYNLGRETFLVPVRWEDGWPVFAPGLGRVPREVSGPADPSDPGDRADDPGVPPGPVLPGDLRWTSLRGPAADFATPHGDGWRLAMRPTRLTETRTPALLAVRQQHRDVDVRVVMSADLAPGEEMGLVIRQSEDDHVRLAVVADPDGRGRRVTATHRQRGADHVLASCPLTETGGDRPGPVTLLVRARGQDYAVLVGSPGRDPQVVAVADGRLLDTVAVGGFLGLWLGVYASSNGQPTDTVAEVHRFEYSPRA